MSGEGGLLQSLKRVGALGFLTLVATLGKLIGRLAPLGQDLRAWALQKRDGLR